MICWLTNSINGTRSLHFAYPTHRVAAIQARTSYAQVGCLLRFTFSGHTRHRQSTNYRLDVPPRVHTLSTPCPQQCLICFSSSSSFCYRLLSNFSDLLLEIGDGFALYRCAYGNNRSGFGTLNSSSFNSL